MVDDLVIDLDLNVTGFRKGIQSGQITLKQFGTHLSQYNRQVQKSAQMNWNWYRSFLETTRTIADVGRALQTLWHITGGWAKSILDVNGEMERTVLLLKNLSKQSSEAAQLREAREELEFLMKTAEETPFSLNAIRDSFVKMKVAGIDPLKDSMIALTDAVAASGGSDQQLTRASVAIQQMAGKGVISMEELRQQLGESVPTAMRAMASGMSLTMGELAERISSGSVEAHGALNLMLGEFDRQFRGVGKEMMSTWTGAMSVMSTAWTKFLLKIGQTSAMDEAKSLVMDIVDLLESPTGDVLAESIGRLIANFAKFSKLAIQFASDHGPAIISIFKLLPAIIGGVLAVSIIKTTASIVGMAAGLKTLVASGGTVTKMFKGVISPVTSLKAAFAGLAGGMTAATGIMGVLRVAIGAMFGPIGLLITLIAGIGKAWFFSGDEGEKALKKINSGVSGSVQDAKLAKEAIKDQQDQVASYAQEILRLQEKLERFQQGGAGGYVVKRLQGQISRAEREQQALLDSIEAGTKKVDEILTGNAEMVAKKQLRMSADAFQKEASLQRTARNNMMLELDESLKNQEISREDHNQRKLEIETDHYAKLEDIESRRIDAAKLMAKQAEGDAQLKIALDNQIVALEEEHSKNRLNAASQLQLIADVTKTTATEANAASSKLDTFMSTLERRAAGARAELEGTSSVYAQWENDVTNGRMKDEFEKLTDAQRDAARARAKMLADDISANERLVAANKALKKGATEQANAERDLFEVRAQLNDNFSEFDAISESVQSRFDQIRKDTKLTTDELIKLSEQEVFVIHAEQAKLAAENVKSLKDSLADFDFLSDESVSPEQAAINAVWKEANKNIAEYQEHLDMVMEGGSRLAKSQAQDTFNALRNGEEENARLEVRADLMDKLKSAQDSYADSKLTDSQKASIAYAREVEQLKFIREQLLAVANPDERDGINQAVNNLINGLGENLAEESKSPFQKMLDDWGDTHAQMEAIGEEFYTGMTDYMRDFVRDGEADWASFRDNIINMLLDVVLNKAFQAIFDNQSFQEGGGFSGALSQGLSTFFGGLFSNGNSATGVATDGLLGGGDPNLAGYSGIPSVSQSATGAIPDLFSKSITGAATPVINVSNESGVPIQTGDVTFDVESQVTNIVMKKMSQPGSFRDGMRSAVRGS